MEVKGLLQSETLKVVQGAANGKVLVSDADGLASWQDAPGGAGGGSQWTTVSDQTLGADADGFDPVAIDLDLNKVYRFFIVGATAAGGAVRLFHNGDTNEANYSTSSQFVVGANVTVGSEAESAIVLDLNAGVFTAEGMLIREPSSGQVVALFTTRDDGPNRATIRQAWSTLATNVTSIQFTNPDGAGETLGAGSRLLVLEEKAQAGGAAAAGISEAVYIGQYTIRAVDDPDRQASIGQLATDGTHLYALRDEDGSRIDIFKIDPESGQVLGTFSLAEDGLPFFDPRFLFAHGFLWLADSSYPEMHQGSLHKIDPATMSAVDTFTNAGDSFISITADDTSIWVSTQEGPPLMGSSARLLRLNPNTLAVIDVFVRDGNQTPMRPIVWDGADRIWFLYRAGGSEVNYFVISTGQFFTVSVGDISPDSLAVAGGFAWAFRESAFDPKSALIKIDPSPGVGLDTFDLLPSPMQDVTRSRAMERFENNVLVLTQDDVVSNHARVDSFNGTTDQYEGGILLGLSTFTNIGGIAVIGNQLFASVGHAIARVRLPEE